MQSYIVCLNANNVNDLRMTFGAGFPRKWRNLQEHVFSIIIFSFLSSAGNNQLRKRKFLQPESSADMRHLRLWNTTETLTNERLGAICEKFTFQVQVSVIHFRGCASSRWIFFKCLFGITYGSNTVIIQQVSKHCIKHMYIKSRFLKHKNSFCIWESEW